jgi:hypothetical protein
VPLLTPPPSAPAAARDHLRLPAAMVRGALAALGLEVGVSAEAAAPPAVDFTVTLRPAVTAAPAVPAPAPPATSGVEGGAGSDRPPVAAA